MCRLSAFLHYARKNLVQKQHTHTHRNPVVSARVMIDRATQLCPHSSDRLLIAWNKAMVSIIMSERISNMVTSEKADHSLLLFNADKDPLCWAITKERHTVWFCALFACRYSSALVDRLFECSIQNTYEKRSSWSLSRDVSATTFLRKSVNVCLMVSISSVLPLKLIRGISEKSVARNTLGMFFHRRARGSLTQLNFATLLSILVAAVLSRCDKKASLFS